jgi:pyrroloquinoline quinone (PQQ) biosynthesis protein C
LSQTQLHDSRVSQEDLEERIRTLAMSAAEHEALNNKFYKLWTSRALTVDQVALFARNFYERVSDTPNRIALAFLHMRDVRARAETVENLADEMGMGDARKAHSVLLRRFFEELLSRIGGAPVDFDTLDAPVLPTTRTLIEEGHRVFSSDIPAEVCGALLAQEWHAYSQLVYIYEGVRNYMPLFSLEEFHENCEYFYLHIGATEKQHKIHSLSTAAQMCRGLEDYHHLERGFTTYLELLSANWNELFEEIDAH